MPPFLTTYGLTLLGTFGGGWMYSSRDCSSTTRTSIVGPECIGGADGTGTGADGSGSGTDADAIATGSGTATGTGTGGGSYRLFTRETSRITVGALPLCGSRQIGHRACDVSLQRL